MRADAGRPLARGGWRAGVSSDTAFSHCTAYRRREGAHSRSTTVHARGRTRTGTGFPPRDFRTRYNFRCCALGRIWSLDFLFTVPRVSGTRFRRGPSSLYTFHVIAGCAWLSSGLQAPSRVSVSPNLTPFTRAFPSRVLNGSSPLRLPISPPRLKNDGGAHCRPALCDPSHGICVSA